MRLIEVPGATNRRGPGQRLHTDDTGRPNSWLASWRRDDEANDWRVWGPNVEVVIVHSEQEAIEEMYRIATVVRLTK